MTNLRSQVSRSNGFQGIFGELRCHLVPLIRFHPNRVHPFAVNAEVPAIFHHFTDHAWPAMKKANAVANVEQGRHGLHSRGGDFSSTYPFTKERFPSCG